MSEKIEINETNVDELLDNLHTEDETKGERFYARKFKSAYVKARKGLVLIAKARKSIKSQSAVEKTAQLLNQIITDLDVYEEE